MNREITHAAEKSSLYFSVWWDDWRAKHTEQPADPQLSPPCAARWHEIAFSCFAFPIAGSLESHAQVLQRPVGHIPLGITAIPSRREGREMQAKRDGQAARREELGGKEPCCGGSRWAQARSWKLCYRTGRAEAVIHCDNVIQNKAAGHLDSSAVELGNEPIIPTSQHSSLCCQQIS